MSDITGYKQVTGSRQLKARPGTFSGFFCSQASGTPTIEFRDSVGDDALAFATGVVTPGVFVPGDYAIGTLTSDATAVTDGDTVVVGATGGTSVTYRAKTVPIAINDVAIGSTADGSAFLANLKKAINGTGDATNYFPGTVVNPDIIAYTLTGTTLVVVFRTIGAGGNSYTTTETSSHLSWGAGTLAGGVATTGATITIGSITYTIVKTLTETVGLTAVPYQVLWVTSDAVCLDNLKLAINEGTGEGTSYSTGTLAHPTVNATTNTNTAQTVQANDSGSAGNSITTTSALTNGSWGATTLTGGTGSDKVIVASFTPVAGTMYRFPRVGTETGLFVIIGGVVSCTPFFD
jgi:hypothetical protein